MSTEGIRAAIKALPLHESADVEAAVDLVKASIRMHCHRGEEVRPPTSKVMAERVEALAEAIENLKAAAAKLDVFTHMSMQTILEKTPEAKSALRELLHAVLGDQVGAAVDDVAKQLRKRVRPEKARPTNWVKTELAEDMAACYYALTHKDPGKTETSGHFLRFLQDVFDVAGIGGDAGKYARKTANAWTLDDHGRLWKRALSNQKWLD